MAEWLRRWTANLLGSARVGSNPILVVILTYFKMYDFLSSEYYGLIAIIEHNVT